MDNVEVDPVRRQGGKQKSRGSRRTNASVLPVDRAGDDDDVTSRRRPPSGDVIARQEKVGGEARGDQPV